MWISKVNNYSENNSDLPCFIFDTQRCSAGRIPQESMWSCKNLAPLEKPQMFRCQFKQDSFILKFVIVTTGKFLSAFAWWDTEQKDSKLQDRVSHHPPGGTTQVGQHHLQCRQSRGRAGKALPDMARCDLVSSEAYESVFEIVQGRSFCRNTHRWFKCCWIKKKKLK